MSTPRSILAQPSFLVEARALEKADKAKLIQTLLLLSQDFRHPGLNSKKIKGGVGDIFECRVSQSIRIVYDLFGDALRCWHVGAHDSTLRLGESMTTHSGTRGEELRYAIEDISSSDLISIDPEASRFIEIMIEDI